MPHSCLLRPQHTLSVSSVELAVTSASLHPTLLQCVSKIEVELAFQLQLLSALTIHHFAIASLALLATKSLALTGFVTFDLLQPCSSALARSWPINIATVKRRYRNISNYVSILAQPSNPRTRSEAQISTIGAQSDMRIRAVA